MGQLTFILGGARSGKSTFAENKAKKLGGRVVYIATAEEKDEEMAARIEVHKRERPSHWQTVEIPINVGQTVTSQQIDADIILLDCLTL
ncbi:MAG: bifunctional adenosylcobinamide kinase/adenosylcobinamide-phosphate guanylyltransferase, partial [Anaerolineales bacterium]|nr:bifunctional adenosylcobinamide kinase/adenosylcobinamide-phosphate guanylyltransferase [Anaerolineales bacterium]